MGMLGESALVVYPYVDVRAALSDGRANDLLSGSDGVVTGPVTLFRRTGGRVLVRRPCGEIARGDDLLENDVGLVIGLFEPRLLLRSAISAGVERALRPLIRRHQLGLIGVAVDEVLPPGGAVVTVLARGDSLNEVDGAAPCALRRIDRTVEPADERRIRRFLAEAQGVIPPTREAGQSPPSAESSSSAVRRSASSGPTRSS